MALLVHYGFALAILIAFSCILTQNSAQVQQQQCMNQLQPCLNYLSANGNPPESCCRPLINMIKSMPECLCSLMSIQGANQAQQAGINITDAQTLPARCGQRINPLGCVTGTPDTRNSEQSSGIAIFQSSSLIPAAVASAILVLLAL